MQINDVIHACYFHVSAWECDGPRHSRAGPWNDQLWRSGGQRWRKRSHKMCRSLAEASYRTAFSRVAVLVWSVCGITVVLVYRTSQGIRIHLSTLSWNASRVSRRLFMWCDCSHLFWRIQRFWNNSWLKRSLFIICRSQPIALCSLYAHLAGQFASTIDTFKRSLKAYNAFYSLSTIDVLLVLPSADKFPLWFSLS